MIVPTSVAAFIWKVVASGKVISIDPALVSKSYVPLVPREPLKVIPPAFVLNVEPAVSEARVAPMEPARLRRRHLPADAFHGNVARMCHDLQVSGRWDGDHEINAR